MQGEFGHIIATTPGYLISSKFEVSFHTQSTHPGGSPQTKQIIHGAAAIQNIPVQMTKLGEAIPVPAPSSKEYERVRQLELSRGCFRPDRLRGH
ncbi:hypothetical protein [Salibacterium halotolerans]|uniref:hypothetical protein n=1 Tax=Salibacterium halotolerans TaxID=1884432 RepID=UPI000B887F36|nr:hypothetical protein [Salibacterium halotolerans]